MIIVDASIWVDHFRRRDRHLIDLIGGGGIALHPFTYAELLLGGIPEKGEIAATLLQLAAAPLASAKEAAAFIGWAELAGTGIGYVDAHLLTSAKLLEGGQVLTRDTKLHAQAERLGVAYRP